MADPIAARHDGRSIRLKWHKLRRQADDPPYDRANLAAGIAVGATMEVDLRLMADGGFAILHDAALDEDTTSRGLVRDIDSDGLSRIRMKSGGPPLSLDELARMQREGPRLHLDLKETAAAITPWVAARFATVMEPVAERFILSGQDAEAVKRLAVPGLALGYDPMLNWRDQGLDRFLDEAMDAMPGMAMCYLSKRLVTACAARGLDPIAPLHAAGIEVDVWTIDENDENLAAALALGADQITTNAPAALAAIIEGRG